MPMYGERLVAAMSCAVPVPIAGAMLAVITVAVTMVIRWRAALPWRRVPQPDGVGTSLTTAPASTHWATDADSTLLRRWLVDSARSGTSVQHVVPAIPQTLRRKLAPLTANKS